MVLPRSDGFHALKFLGCGSLSSCNNHGYSLGTSSKEVASRLPLSGVGKTMGRGELAFGRGSVLSMDLFASLLVLAKAFFRMTPAALPLFQPNNPKECCVGDIKDVKQFRFGMGKRDESTRRKMRCMEDNFLVCYVEMLTALSPLPKP